MNVRVLQVETVLILNLGNGELKTTIYITEQEII